MKKAELLLGRISFPTYLALSGERPRQPTPAIYKTDRCRPFPNNKISGLHSPLAI
jgi:hypothetical protein